jgi:hypothetical protein
MAANEEENLLGKPKVHRDPLINHWRDDPGSFHKQVKRRMQSQHQAQRLKEDRKEFENKHLGLADLKVNFKQQIEEERKGS